MELNIFGSKDYNFEPSKENISLNDMYGRRRSPNYDISKLVPDMPYDKRYGDAKVLPLITPDTKSYFLESQAREQSGWGLFGSAIAQGFVGELIGGTIESIGTLPKIIDRAMGNTDAFEKNFLEELGGGIREAVSDFAPIYQTQEAQKGLAFGDATYWANMAPSMISTISIMLPAAGISWLGRLGITGSRYLKGAKELSNISKVVEGAETSGKVLSEAARLAKGAAKGAAIEGELTTSLWAAAKQASIDARVAGSWEYKVSDILLPATISRSIDSGRESVGRYEQYYNEYKEKFKDDFDGGEARAKRVASEAAAEGYRESYANIAFDIVEWTILGGLKSSPINKLKSLVDNNIFKKVLTDKLGVEAATQLGVQSASRKFSDVVARGIKSDFVKNVGGSVIAEGFDETMMDFFMENGKYNAEVKNNIRKADGETIIDRVIKHHQQAKNWDSFVGGALGGAGMVSVMSGANKIQSKFFNKENNEYVANIANSYISERKNIENTFKQYNTARSLNTPEGDRNAATLEAQLISNTVGNAHATGTLGLHIKAFENMALLNDEDKAGMDFYKSDTGEVIQGTDLYTNEILDSIKTAQTIYDLEFSKRHHLDNGVNNQLSHTKAYHKSIVAVLNKDIEQLKKENDLVDNSKIIENRISELNTISEQSNVDGTIASSLHDTISNHNTQLDKLQNRVDSLDGHVALNKTILDAMEQEVVRIETEKSNPNNTPARKNKLEVDLVKAKQNVITIKSNIAASNTKMENAKQSIEDTKTKLKTDVESIKVTNNLNDEFVKQIETIHDDYKTHLDNNNQNKRNIDFLNSQVGTHNDRIAELNTPEGVSEFAKSIFADREVSKQTVVSEFQENVDSMLTEDEINNHLIKVSKEHTLTKEVITKLVNITKARINKLKQDKINTDNVNADATSAAETIPVTKEQAEKNPLLASINRRRNESINSITRASVFQQVANAVRGKKYKSFSYTYETANGNIIEVSNLRTDGSQENNSNSKPTTEQELEALHNGVYDNTKIGEVKFKTPQEAKEHIEKVYAQELSARATESLLTLPLPAGQEIVQNGTETEVVAPIVEEVVEIPTFVNGQFQNNIIDNNLVSSIEEHSAKVKLDKDTHTYTYTVGDKSTSNTGSASSMLLAKPFTSTSSKGLNDAKVGIYVDEMIRDFFQGKLQEASKYNMSNEAYNNLVKYLDEIGTSIKAAGFTVLANDISLFDEESGVAGQIDLLLVNEKGQVYIYDIKTSKGFKSWTNKYKFQYDSTNSEKVVNPSKLDKYLAQLNIYAALFEKIHGIKVNGLGFIIFDVEFDSSEIISVEPNKMDTRKAINSSYNVTVDESKERLESYNGIPNTDIDDNSIVGFPVNYSFLHNLSNVKDVDDNHISIYKVLNLKKIASIIEEYSTSQLSQFVTELMQGTDGISSQNETPELIHISNIINALYEYDAINKTFTLRNTTENIEYVLQSLAQVLNKAEDEKANRSSVIKFVMDNTTTQNKELINTVINAGFEQYDNLDNLRNAIDKRESSTLEGGYSRSQRQNADRIIANIRTLSNLHLESEVAYFRIPILRTELFTNLIALQKSLTNSDNFHMSIETAIMLLLKASEINGTNNTDISEIISSAESLINIMEYFKKDIISARARIISQRISDLNDKYDDNISYNEETDTFSKSTGEPIEDVINDSMFEYYDSLYKNIYMDIKTTVFNDTKVTETKIYTKERIAEIIEKYNNTKYSDNNGLGMTVNPIMKDSETSMDTKAIIAESIMNARIGDLVNVSITENGDLEFHIPGQADAIGVMANISTHINGLRISRKGSNKYQGFANILPIIEELLTNTKDGIVGSLDLLRDIKMLQVIAESNNVTDFAKKTAVGKIDSLISKILKAKEDTAEHNIKTIVEQFIRENSDVDEAYDVTSTDIDNVIKTLFFNSHAELFTDKTILNAKSIINNVAAFDKVQSLNHVKYRKFASKLNNKNQVVKGKINNISRASILTHNRGISDRIEDVVKPIDMQDGTLPEIVLATNKKSIIRNGKTGKLLTGRLKNVGSIRAVSVVIENTNGEFTTIPFNQRTISEFIGFNDVIGSEENTGGKYIDYISGVINNIINTTQKLLVGEEGLEIRSQIETIIKNSGIEDLIITGGNKDSKSDEFPYFANFYDSKTKEYVIKFKTVSRDEVLGNVTIHHAIVFNKNEMHYSKIDTSYSLNLKERKASAWNVQFSGTDVFSKDTHVKVRFGNNEDMKIFNKALTDSKTGIGGLLRQAHVSEDGLSFKNGDSFTDPVSGVTHTNAQDYLFSTNAGYAQIDVIKDSTGKKISNVNVSNKVVFDIDLEGATTMQTGTIENPLKDIIDNNPNIEEVIDIIDNINSELDILFKDRIVEVHEGAHNKNFDDKTIIEAGSSTQNGVMTFSMTYYDRFAKSLLLSSYYSNPIINILHENIHKVLMAVTNLNSLNDTEKAKIIKYTNDNALAIIESFEQQYELVKDDVEWNKKFGKYFNAGHNVAATIEKMIETIKTDISDANTNLNKGILDSSSIAQELFTYMTNPALMLAFSTVSEVADSKYNSKTEKSFISNLIDKLISIYNKILDVLGISEKLDANYTTQIKDLLNDVYNAFTKSSDFIEGSEINNVNPIVTPSVATTENVIPTRQKVSRIDTREVQTLDLDNSEISSIFAMNNIINTETNVRDDANYIIC